MGLKQAVIGLIGVGAVAGAGVCPFCRDAGEARAAGAALAGSAAVVAEPVPAAESKTVTLQVKGMTCGGCAIAARIALEKLDGVKSAAVSYEESRAVVKYDPQKVTVERMIAALKKLGYEATVVPA